MVLLRQGTTSDIEVSMTATPDGMRYKITGPQNSPVAAGVDAVQAYSVLVDFFTKDQVKLPSKFVIEFAQFVIGDLTTKLNTK
jgi:hypothetical protein